MNFGLIPLVSYKPAFKLMQIPLNLPESVDLRSKCPPVYDQGNLGSCTACSVVAAHQFLNKNHYGSRLFLYYNTRLLDKTIKFDAGSTLTQTINAGKKFGICPETNWRYIPTKFRNRPTSSSYSTGRKNMIFEAEPIMPTISQLKACLAEGYPFVCGILVYSSFLSGEVKKTGRVPMPKPGDEILGGHAIVCVGYNQEGWIMRNSWGPKWGDRGHFYLPFSYLIDEMAADFWKITKVQMPPVRKPIVRKPVIKKVVIKKVVVKKVVVKRVIVKKPIVKKSVIPLKMQFIGGRLI
jgi:C1A family cysteine protease